jgi:hypothetical protein
MEMDRSFTENERRKGKREENREEKREGRRSEEERKRGRVKCEV